MDILITGNMGYVGPPLINRLRYSYPKAKLIGFDMGYFSNCLTNAGIFPECNVDVQYFADVRHFPADILNGVDAIVYLSAISNDPMGKIFEDVTFEVNCNAGVDIAKQAKARGVRAFVYASSCSIYGYAEGEPRNEMSPLNPLTAYAKSKVACEKALEPLANDKFIITSLRFSTACGMSERLRLDLVLNDFVACAVASKKIAVLSDGTPWRPLINVKDMAGAIDWAINRNITAGGQFLAVNVGSNQWNYQVKELAEAVAACIPGVDVSINKNAQPDKRSYKVCFDLYKQLAPDYQPQYNLKTTIEELKTSLEAMGFANSNFHESKLVRLKMLTQLINQGLLTENLEWKRPQVLCSRRNFNVG